MRRWALILCLALVASACSPFGGNNDGLEIEAEFPRTFNLFEGSRVKVLGVDSGRIEEITIPEGGTHVLVRMRLHPDVQVPEDVGAAIIQGALLGERYIQLHPPYVDGPEMENGGRIPEERTVVPVEFEESFDALEDALETLDPDEVARLVVNLAGTLDGQGESLGEMIETLRDLIEAIRESDDELVDLAITLADLNETVGVRAEEIAEQYVNLGRVAESLADERVNLRRTLEGLLRMTTEVGDLVATHRPTLEEDIPTLARVGRTIGRNLDYYETYLIGQAEVYRHAVRVGDEIRNWGWTRNHYDDMPRLISHRITQRLVGLCLRMGLDECADLDFWTGLLSDEMCLPPLVECPEGEEMPSVADELERSLDEVPELRERLEEERENDLQDLVDELSGAMQGDEVRQPEMAQ
jgi:phospholipid/cholesterol/gamma-HCH transport system substrate-binding protein